MGAVYKALDTRLDRLVAIKVSTNQFAGSLSSVCDGGSGIPQGHVAVVGSVVEACNGTGPEFRGGLVLPGRRDRGVRHRESRRALRESLCVARPRVRTRAVDDRSLLIPGTATVGQVR